jgi:hypothetical protein
MQRKRKRGELHCSIMISVQEITGPRGETYKMYMTTPTAHMSTSRPYEVLSSSRHCTTSGAVDR